MRLQPFDVNQLAGRTGDRAVLAYAEWRSKLSEGQYLTLLFYHAFVLLEVRSKRLIKSSSIEEEVN